MLDTLAALVFSPWTLVALFGAELAVVAGVAQDWLLGKVTTSGERDFFQDYSRYYVSSAYTVLGLGFAGYAVLLTGIGTGVSKRAEVTLSLAFVFLVSSVFLAKMTLTYRLMFVLQEQTLEFGTLLLVLTIFNISRAGTTTGTALLALGYSIILVLHALAYRFSIKALRNLARSTGG